MADDTSVPNPLSIESSLILLVEDDIDTRAIIRQTLVSLGHFVVEAVDGIEAQARVAEQLPDLIVLDLMMPRMTGMEFVKWFRDERLEPYVPVLMLTALGEIDQKVAGLTQGADDYQTKPFNYRELQARVQALLRTRKLTAALYRRTEELREANVRLEEMQTALVAKERELVASQMAGTAAHNLGQPITTALLHCHLLEKALKGTDGSDRDHLAAALQATRAIHQECETMRNLVAKLKSVDGTAVQEYVGGMKILDIEGK